MSRHAYRPNRFLPRLEALETRSCPAVLHPAGTVRNVIADGQPGRVMIVQPHPADLPAVVQVVAAKRRRRHRVRPHRVHPGPHPGHVPVGTTPGRGGSTAGPRTTVGDVLVNGQPLSRATIHALAQIGVQARPGSFWYDNVSGATGVSGLGTLGFIPAGLGLGGPLQADASNGTSGVFINGRQATTGEVAFLQALTGAAIPPGRYFLDANGNAGPEGGPVAVNLIQSANQRGRQSPLTTYDRTGISVLADGSFVGVLDHDGGSVTFD
jgi:hypothetical protein